MSSNTFRCLNAVEVINDEGVTVTFTHHGPDIDFLEYASPKGSISFPVEGYYPHSWLAPDGWTLRAFHGATWQENGKPLTEDERDEVEEHLTQAATLLKTKFYLP